MSRMTAVTDPVLIEAGRDNHQYLPFSFVKLSKDRSELCIDTYPRHSRSLDPGDEIGTLKLYYLTQNEYRD